MYNSQISQNKEKGKVIKHRRDESSDAFLKVWIISSYVGSGEYFDPYVYIFLASRSGIFISFDLVTLIYLSACENGLFLLRKLVPIRFVATIHN